MTYPYVAFRVLAKGIGIIIHKAIFLVEPNQGILIKHEYTITIGSCPDYSLIIFCQGHKLIFRPSVDYNIYDFLVGSDSIDPTRRHCQPGNPFMVHKNIVYFIVRKTVGCRK